MAFASETDPTGLRERRPDQKSPRAVLGRLLGWSFILLAVISTVVVALFELRHLRCDQGVLAADMIGVAPRVAGLVKELSIIDNQFVHKGDLLFEIDAAPYKLSVDAAAANLAMAEGEVKNTQLQIASQQDQAKAAIAAMQQAQTAQAEAKDNYDRVAPLLAKRYASALDVDKARRALESTTAGVAAAQAKLSAAQSAVPNIAAVQAKRDAAAVSLAQAELELSYCTVKAPFDGLVSGLNISPGAYAHVGTELFQLIDADSWWVSEPYQEWQLHRFKVGDHASVELMTAPGRLFDGVVESIGWGVTPMPASPRPGLPVVPRELDWVRLAQRFPVKIKLSKNVPAEFLRIGATATSTIEPGR
jgi:membrane fusion protein, multidrug efflux system